MKKSFEKVVDRTSSKWYDKWVAWVWQKVTTKVVKENGLWKLNRIYKYI